MNKKFAAALIAVGSIFAAQFAASVGNYFAHEVFYSGGGLDEGAAFSASMVGGLIWILVVAFGWTWAYKIFSRSNGDE